MNAYTVKTPSFEGPLDLLLELVSKRKLFVNDLSLAEVTDDFVRYLEERHDFPISESAEFILIASTLMLIKSRSLLPQLELTEDEEESIHELEARLVTYARVKELALLVAPLFGRRMIFEKEPRQNHRIVFTPDAKTNKDYLLTVLERVIESFPKFEILPKVIVKKVVSLEEMMEKLALRITQSGKMRFRDLKHKDKTSIIVGFLAMLELVKRGALRVTQNGRDIEMESESVRLPHYA